MRTPTTPGGNDIHWVFKVSVVVTIVALPAVNVASQVVHWVASWWTAIEWEQADDYEDEDGETGWTTAAVNVMGDDHKVRVLNERCTTCILGGSQSITPHLRRGRLKDLVTRAADGHVPCHSTLDNASPRAAVCAGWFEKFGMQSNYIRVMSRLGGLTFVPLPTKDDAP